MRRYLSTRPARDVLVVIAFLGVVCLLGFSIYWGYRHFKSEPPYVDPVLYPVRGIDISRHNGVIDFEKVAQDGIEFVFIKATEGKNHIDDRFDFNYENAKKAGLKIGAYHFFRFDVGGLDQALNFLQVTNGKEFDMPFVIDVEKNGNPMKIPLEKIKENLTAMVEYLHLSGCQVMIYTNHDGYYDYIAETLPGYPLWICRFQENPIDAEWTFWQYDHHGNIKGIIGDVDLNAFCGNREKWQKFLDGEIWPY